MLVSATSANAMAMAGESATCTQAMELAQAQHIRGLETGTFGGLMANWRSFAVPTLTVVTTILLWMVLMTGRYGDAFRLGGCRADGIRGEDPIPVQEYNSSAAELAQHQLLEQLYKHEVELPHAILRRAISHAGDPERLQRALHKLIRGDPLTIATVGGSVTAGEGAKIRSLCFRERLFDWFRTTFPNDRHVFFNGGLAAAPSSYISQCIHDFAPLEADIVFLEFSVNDEQADCDMATDGRQSFERLLRTILRYPKAPAVVVLHWWSPRTKKFEESAEDHLDVFSKFYGLPALSWRDGLHRLIESNASGFSPEELYVGVVHPNGYNGHRHFADIIIGFLREEAAAMVLGGFNASSPVVNSSDVTPIQQPMLPGNYKSQSSCFRDRELQKVVVSNDGWEWKNEGREDKPKWGYVSWQPGSKLLLKVNTATYARTATVKVVIGVGVLKSYEHMGQAQLSCVSGCSCDHQLLEGHWEEKTSQKKWIYASATQASNCTMAITSLNSTSSGEHKVVVNSFLVTDIHGNGVSWLTDVDDLKVRLERQKT